MLCLVRPSFFMNSRPARTLVVAASVAAATLCGVDARSYSMEKLSCLFELARPQQREPLIRLSFLPLAERLALAKAASRSRPSIPALAEPDEPQASDEFNLSFVQPLHSPVESDTVDDWPLLQALRRWQSVPQVKGLSRSLGSPQSIVAFDYSDIFETGRAPYKGGHGVSLFFRHNIRN